MNDIVVRSYEVILVAFIVSGLVTTVYNDLTFRIRVDDVVRKRGAGRGG